MDARKPSCVTYASMFEYIFFHINPNMARKQLYLMYIILYGVPCCYIVKTYNRLSTGNAPFYKLFKNMTSQYKKYSNTKTWMRKPWFLNCNFFVCYASKFNMICRLNIFFSKILMPVVYVGTAMGNNEDVYLSLVRPGKCIHVPFIQTSQA